MLDFKSTVDRHFADNFAFKTNYSSNWKPVAIVVGNIAIFWDKMGLSPAVFEQLKMMIAFSAFLLVEEAGSSFSVWKFKVVLKLAFDFIAPLTF